MRGRDYHRDAGIREGNTGKFRDTNGTGGKGRYYPPRGDDRHRRKPDNRDGRGTGRHRGSGSRSPDRGQHGAGGSRDSGRHMDRRRHTKYGQESGSQARRDDDRKGQRGPSSEDRTEPPTKRRKVDDWDTYPCESLHTEDAADTHVRTWCAVVDAMNKRLDGARRQGVIPSVPTRKTEKFFKTNIIGPYMKAANESPKSYPPPQMTTFMNHFKYTFHVKPDTYKAWKTQCTGTVGSQTPLVDRVARAAIELSVVRAQAEDNRKAADLLRNTCSSLVAEKDTLQRELQAAKEDAKSQARALQNVMRSIMREQRSETQAQVVSVADRGRDAEAEADTRLNAIEGAIFIRLHRKVARFKQYHLRAGRLDPRLFVELLSREAMAKMVSVTSLEVDTKGKVTTPQRLSGVHIFLCGGKGSTTFKATGTRDGAGMEVPTDVFPDVVTSPTGDMFVFAYLTDVWVVPATEAATGIDGRPGLVERSFSTKTFPWALQGSAIALPVTVTVGTWSTKDNVKKGVETSVAHDIAWSLRLLTQRPTRGAPLFQDQTTNVILDAPTDLFMPAATVTPAPIRCQASVTSTPTVWGWTMQRRIAAAKASLLSDAAVELMQDANATVLHTAAGTMMVPIGKLFELHDSGRLKTNDAVRGEVTAWHAYYRVPAVTLGECVSLLVGVARAADRTQLLQANLGVRRTNDKLHIVLLRVVDDQPLHVEVADKPHAFQSLNTPIPTSRQTRPRFPVGLQRPTTVKGLPWRPLDGGDLSETALGALRRLSFDLKRLPNVSEAISPIGTSTVLPSTAVHGGPAPLYEGTVRAVLQWATDREDAQEFAYSIAEAYGADKSVIDTLRADDPVWEFRTDRGLTTNRQREQEAILEGLDRARKKRGARQVRHGLRLHGAIRVSESDEVVSAGGVSTFDLEPDLLALLRDACDECLPQSVKSRRWKTDRSAPPLATHSTLFRAVDFQPQGRGDSRDLKYADMPPVFTAFLKAFHAVNTCRLSFLDTAPEPWRTAHAEQRIFGGFAAVHVYAGKAPQFFHNDNPTDGIVAITVNVGTRVKHVHFQDRETKSEAAWKTHEVTSLPGQGYVANVASISHKVVPDVASAPEKTVLGWWGSDATIIFRTALKEKEHKKVCELMEARAQVQGIRVLEPKVEHAKLDEFLRTFAQRTADGWEIPTYAEVRAYAGPDLPSSHGRRR